MLTDPMALCGEQKAQAGTLYVVATPLGNLGDLTLRAIRILETCDVIACETPRITQRLLSALGIQKKRLFTYRDAGEAKSAQHLIDILKNGHSVALVSDAGTPTINDPGYRLVKQCRDEHIPVIPIPGANAALTALSISGFPTHAFVFLGFLPVKSGAHKRLLETYKNFDGSIIFYESPYRIRKTVAALKEIFEPERLIFIARELTKFNESFYRRTLPELDENSLPEKGEYTVVVAPK
jgi:16S rRNA (cytidine1402-2'-O)-methyltransferase